MELAPVALSNRNASFVQPNTACEVGPSYQLRSICRDAKREIDSLVADQVFVADLDPDGVEENQRIARLERPVLPSAAVSSTASVTVEIRSGDTSSP